MNFKKVVFASIITAFATTSLIAGPCINCVSTVYQKNSQTQTSGTKWSTKSILKVEEKQNSEIYYADDIIALDDNENQKEYIDSMIALDDNNYDSNEPLISENESDIILTYDDSPQIDKLTKTLYACDDIINNIVACDEEKREECECV